MGPIIQQIGKEAAKVITTFAQKPEAKHVAYMALKELKKKLNL